MTFNKEDEAIYFKPYLKEEDNLVYLTKLNPNMANTTINIYAIYDSEVKLCHSEYIENTQIIEKIFKLEKQGNYKITINSDNKEYTTFINN